MFHLEPDAVFQGFTKDGLTIFAVKKHKETKISKKVNLCPKKLQAARDNRDYINSLLGK